MTIFNKVKITEIAEVKGGKRLPKGHDFSEIETDHLYIRARDIGSGKIQIAEPVYIEETTYKIISNYTVSEGDIVVTIVGANIGDVGFISGDFSGANLTENAAKISVNRKLCNPIYLKFFLANDHAKAKFQYIASGAAQGKLGLFKIKDFDVFLPPLIVQDKIASILSNYDDLIENNRRRIQLLEDSARLLYREWFVHLRFPGHEHVKIVEGVPAGWQSRKLGEVLTLNYGKALNADARVPGAYPVYGSSGVVGTHEKALVTGPGIIVGRKGNVGSVYWSSKDFYPIDTVYFINAEQSNLYLYYALQYMQFINTDVAVPGLNRDMAYSRYLLTPPATILQSFITQATTIRQQIEKLAEFNAKLVEARDLLLPRLMSGEISV